MLVGTDEIESANAHVRRVTLNLMRHAACCPEDVRFVGDKLASMGWNWDSLTKLEAEALFTFVTAETAAAAVGEFYADTTTIHDLHRDAATADGEYIDGDGDTHCPLCGHKHIRWGFIVRNDAGGLPFRCGSSCVIQYGLRVDGEATAESALKKLNAAIAKLEKKARREDWRTAHPDHADTMQIVVQASRIVNPATRHDLPWFVRSAMREDHGGYVDTVFADWGKSARAAVKYYRANGFLTHAKSAWLYAGGGFDAAREIVASMERAQTALITRKTAWVRFFAANPVMRPYHRDRLTGCMEAGYDLEELSTFQRQLVREVKEANRITLPPPPDQIGEASFEAEDDFSDLPF